MIETTLEEFDGVSKSVVKVHRPGIKVVDGPSLKTRALNWLKGRMERDPAAVLQAAIRGVVERLPEKLKDEKDKVQEFQLARYYVGPKRGYYFGTGEQGTGWENRLSFANLNSFGVGESTFMHVNKEIEFHSNSHPWNSHTRLVKNKDCCLAVVLAYFVFTNDNSIVSNYWDLLLLHDVQLKISLIRNTHSKVRCATSHSMEK